jgi:toxin YhaV
VADRHFLSQYQKLLTGLEAKAKVSKDGVSGTRVFKIHKAVSRIIYQEVPSNPASNAYSLGNTLSSSHATWRRAKFFGQYRLFFRFDSKSKIIIYSWFNDEESLRAYGSKTDAYLIFEKMLNQGDPPSNWESLLGSAE